VRRVEVDREAVDDNGDRVAAVTLQLTGRGDLTALAAELTELGGVRAARTGRDAGFDEG
jgi:putative Mg2+ transporter-C (MgtC) family protein